MSDTGDMSERGRRAAIFADIKARYTSDPLGRVLASMEYVHRVWGDGGRLAPTTVEVAPGWYAVDGRQFRAPVAELPTLAEAVEATGGFRLIRSVPGGTD